jgi:hypothetical protein
MKFKCAYSGITFKVDSFSAFVGETAGYVHPAHWLPASKIAALVSSWEASPSSFSKEDSTLLISCLLNLGGQVDFNEPLAPLANSIFSKIPALASCIFEMLAIPANVREACFPRLSIRNSHSLENLASIIEEWNTCISAQAEAFRTINRNERAKTIAQKYISAKNARKSAPAARALANWAAIAGAFPEGLIPHPISLEQIPLSTYWKEIISSLGDPARLFEFPEIDVRDCADHCFETISINDWLAPDLFAAFESSLSKRASFIKFGFTEGVASHISTAAAHIIFDDSMNAFEDSEKSAAALANLRESAPAQAPVRENFTSMREFLIAKIAFASANKT